MVWFMYLCSERSNSGNKGTYRWLPKQDEIQKEEKLKASRKKPDSPTSVRDFLKTLLFSSKLLFIMLNPYGEISLLFKFTGNSNTRCY